MSEGQIAVFIPIVMFLVIGLILVTYFYFRSRERQLLIDKGMSIEDIKEFFKQKRDPFILLKIGIISIFFGLGIGFGMMLEDGSGKEYWMPLSIFVLTGLGFVISNIVGNNLKKKDQSEGSVLN